MEQQQTTKKKQGLYIYFPFLVLVLGFLLCLIALLIPVIVLVSPFYFYFNYRGKKLETIRKPQQRKSTYLFDLIKNANNKKQQTIN